MTPFWFNSLEWISHFFPLFFVHRFTQIPQIHKNRIAGKPRKNFFTDRNNIILQVFRKYGTPA